MGWFCSSGGSSSNNTYQGPNASQIAAAQGAESRISQFTPQGNLLYGTVNAAGGFDQGQGGNAMFVEQTPFQESARASQEAVSDELLGQAVGRAAGLPGSPISYEGLPAYSHNIDFGGIDAVPTAADFSEDALRVEDATYQRALGLLNPELERREGQLMQGLANQGLPIGSEAYDDELGRFGRERNELLGNIALDAVGAGRAEQSRLFGQAMNTRGAQLSDILTQMDATNRARATGFGERGAIRSNQFNELAAMLGGQQVQPAGLGNFIPPSPVDVTGAYGIQAAGQNAAAQQRAAQQQSMMSGLFGLGSAGILGSLLRTT